MKNISILLVFVCVFSLKAMNDGDEDFEKKLESSNKNYLERSRCIDGLSAQRDIKTQKAQRLKVANAANIEQAKKKYINSRCNSIWGYYKNHCNEYIGLQDEESLCPGLMKAYRECVKEAEENYDKNQFN